MKYYTIPTMLFITQIVSCMSWTPYDYIDPIKPDELIKVVVEDCDKCVDYRKEFT